MERAIIDNRWRTSCSKGNKYKEETHMEKKHNTNEEGANTSHDA